MQEVVSVEPKLNVCNVCKKPKDNNELNILRYDLICDECYKDTPDKIQD